MLGILLGKIQQDIGNNANLFKASKFLKDDELQEKAKRIWAK